MKIRVKAKPGAKKESVQKIERAEGLFAAATGAGGAGAAAALPQFVVAVKERPVKGSANRAVEKAVAEYFGVAPARVRIVSGHASREKIVEIVDR